MAGAGATTVSELFAATVAEYEHEPALRTPDGAVAWTWGEYGRAAAAAAGGLADVGAALLGAASSSIYPTYAVEQAAHVLWDAESTELVTEPAVLERALAVR